MSYQQSRSESPETTSSTDLNTATGLSAPGRSHQECALPVSSRTELERAVQTLSKNKDRWAALNISRRIELIDQIMADTADAAEIGVRSAVSIKGNVFNSVQEAEEWLTGPVLTMRNLRLLRETLLAIDSQGLPALPGEAQVLPGGRTSVPVFPCGIYDRVLFPGFTANVRFNPGVTPENLSDSLAAAYKRDTAGRVALVLGAGNVPSIAPTDTLYKLFVEKQTVILKLNPANQYLGPAIEYSMRSLIREGFVRIVYGGAPEGRFLAGHPAVDTVHITGSDKTHDALVYGTDSEAAGRKLRGEKLLTKPVTSELGNVSPVIIVPGQWSKSDLRFQAWNIASSLANNAGFNCNASRVIITHGGWPQRAEFLNMLRAAFAEIPLRNAYYPGAHERYSEFKSTNRSAEQIGKSARDGELPWMIIPGLSPADAGNICFRKEAFSCVIAEAGIDAGSPADFLGKAAAFANQHIYGSLNASIMVHPGSLRDQSTKDAMDGAISDLQYGTVAINHWAALGYAFISPPWGAYGGARSGPLESGHGFVHNTYMLENIEKTVLNGPFRMFPKPVWFQSHRTAHRIAPLLVEFEKTPSLTKLPALGWNTLWG